MAGFVTNSNKTNLSHPDSGRFVTRVMDPSAYRLRSRSVPPNPLDHGQVVHTEIEGTPQSEVGERSTGRASPGLMFPGISSSVAGPEVESASSGEKTLRSDTRGSASADISETPPMPMH